MSSKSKLPSLLTYKIAHFSICEKYLKEFSRLAAHPSDYVINSLETIGVVDKKDAEKYITLKNIHHK